MSTSLLYHMFGIRGYEYRSTEYLCGTTFVRIELPRVGHASRESISGGHCHVVRRGRTHDPSQLAGTLKLRLTFGLSGAVYSYGTRDTTIRSMGEKLSWKPFQTSAH